MGLILKLPFDGRTRTIEIDSERNIRFLDHDDLVYEQAMVGFGGKESAEAKLFRLYGTKGARSLMEPTPVYYPERPDYFDRDTCKDWTMRFIQALKKQGFRAYGTGIEDTPFGIAEMIYYSGMAEELTEIKIYLDELADDEDEAASWVIDWLRESVSKMVKYEGHDAELAELLGEYLDADEFQVTVNEILYACNDSPYENTEAWRYKIAIRGETLLYWTECRRAVIWDPLTFKGGEVEEDPDDECVVVRERGEELANAFGHDLPDVRPPELPDHPVSDEHGDFAVLYEFDDEYKCRVVPYASQDEAEQAVELSGAIFEDRGQGVTMTLMRRLTREERPERTQVEMYDPDADEEDEPEWRDEWAPLEPE